MTEWPRGFEGKCGKQAMMVIEIQGLDVASICMRKSQKNHSYGETRARCSANDGNKQHVSR